MDRLAELKKRLDAAGITDHTIWLYEEQAQGEKGTLVEAVTLFQAIQAEMLDRSCPEWIDQFARNISNRQCKESRFHDAIRAVAASNVDRKALVEVIRYCQSHIAFMFLNVHDGSRPASYSDEDLAFRLAYENRADYASGDYERRPDRMKLLTDDLHALFENFLESSGDDFSSQYERG
jgi:hypothetical protein